MLVNDDNTCGVYIGSVRIYGEEANALAIIRDYLDRDGSGENIHSHLRRLFSVGVSDGTVNVEEPYTENSGGGSGGMPAPAIASLAAALVTGIVALAAFQMRRKRRKNSGRSSISSSSLASIDPSNLQSEISSALDEFEVMETINLAPGNDALVVANGRPQTIIDTDAQTLSKYRPEVL